MVVDEDGRSRLPRLLEPASAVRENHNSGTGGGRGTNRVDNASHAVVFVVVSSGTNDKGVLAARGADRSNGADVTFNSWLRKSRDFCCGKLCDGLADEVSSFRPP